MQAFPQHAGGLWIELGRDGDPNQARTLGQAARPLAAEQPERECERECEAGERREVGERLRERVLEEREQLPELAAGVAQQPHERRVGVMRSLAHR